MKIPIAKEGLLYVIIPFITGIIFLFAKFWVLAIVSLSVSISICLFFREPNRVVSRQITFKEITDKHLSFIYAPADGKIIHIGEELEDVFFKDIVHKISIFMSIFNVHINYAPVNGVVDFIKYNPGSFKRADVVSVMESNENNFVGISNDSVRVGVRQVAGWIARRIVCDCRLGDRLSAGERFGLVKFGSRVDVYIPKEYSFCVKLGDCVRAGRTVLGSKR